MHVKALGFARNPFPYTPDAHNYFLTAHIEQQFAELTHCILDRKGFFLLTADIGLGKSTLVRRLIMTMQQQQVRCALVVNTFLQGSELLGAIVSDFGLPATGDLYQDHKTLNDFLLEMHRKNITCLVVIDDAQNLLKSSLEMIRLLSNLETDQEKLVQILLVGQQELDVALTSIDLRQLKSRIAHQIRLQALSFQESLEYVAFKLQSSSPGSDVVAAEQTISVQAARLLWVASRGVPRSMHVILDRCLYGLLTKNECSISVQTMNQAIAETCNLREGFAGGGHSVSARSAGAFTAVPRFAAANQIFALAAVVAVVVPVVFLAGWWMQSSQALAFTLPLYPRISNEVASQKLPVEQFQAQSVSLTSIEAKPSSPTQQTPPVSSAVQTLAVSPTVITPAIASCSNTSAQQIDTPTADVPQQARLSVKTWALIGQKLQQSVKPCFDAVSNEYQISWTAPNTQLGFPARSDIAKYQIGLANFGSLVPTKVDCIYGNQTIEAVKVLQTDLAIPVSGRLDPLTTLVLSQFFIN